MSQTILFDLDGTLIDTTGLILRCFEHCWSSVCGVTHSREALIGTFGIPLREAMRRLLAYSDGDSAEASERDELIERLLSEYRSFNVANHDLLAQSFEGAREAVFELRGRGYKIGVVTSKSREMALRGLRLCGLESLVDAAIFLEDTACHKPDPEPVLAALERLSAHPLSAAYVGDSPHDIEAGRRAGVQTVAALWGPATQRELEAARPDHMVASFHDLLDIFECKR